MLFLRAVFLLVGTVIGAGIFALPYVFSQSGFLPSLLGLLFLGLLMIILNLFYSEIILDNSGDHQLPGYVKKYLGKNWSILSLVAILFSLNGAVLAYVVLSREFLSLSMGRLSSQLYSLWFYILAVSLFWQGFKFLAKVQFLLVLGLILLSTIIPFGLGEFIQLENYSLIGARPLFFWGATLFALTGFSVIPEVEEVLRKKRSFLSKAVIWGSLLPVVLYFIFGFGIWGASGVATTVDAFSGIVSFSPGLARIGAIIGLLALITSFLSLVNIIKEVYFRDLGLSKTVSKAMAVIPAFFGIFLSLGSFIQILSLVGALGLTISGSLICFIFAKLRPKFKWLAWLVSMVFVLGAVSQLLWV